MLKISQFGPVTRYDLARTIAGKGRYWTSAYLVDGLMVDTGCAHSADELMSGVREEYLTMIVNTHSHEDHIGANAALVRRKDVRDLFTHPMAVPILADPTNLQPLQPYRRFFWGWPEPTDAQALEDGSWIETDHYRFQIIYTPGHSPDHICLYEPDQEWLFTGDLYVGGRDRALREEYNIWQILQSLKLVVELPLKKLFPGSARVRENPVDTLKNKITYLEELGERVFELNAKGWSVSAMVRALCGGPKWVELVTLGHFSRRHLVLSYLEDRAESS
jgi:glyoxylase-like metal-dependent hydrolase (beta-lactamase superfamily II)